MSARNALARWLSPLGVSGSALRGLRGYAWFFGDARRYRRMPGHTLPWGERWPMVLDRVGHTPFDAHYFYMDNWALRRVLGSGADWHVDVASRVDTVAHMAASMRVTFIDIRPLPAEVEGLECRAGSVLDLPFPDQSVPSLSCLHVAEHVGLGRYGDPLDPQGTVKACKELERVLAPGGNLFFALPVGRPRVVFNAHRVHDPEDILRLFPELALVEFSHVDDAGAFHRGSRPADAKELEYGCGMFWFTRTRKAKGARA